MVSSHPGLSVLKHLVPSVVFLSCYMVKKGKDTKSKERLPDRVGRDPMSSKAKGLDEMSLTMRPAPDGVTNYLSLLRTEELPGPRT